MRGLATPVRASVAPLAATATAPGAPFLRRPRPAALPHPAARHQRAASQVARAADAPNAGAQTPTVAAPTLASLPATPASDAAAFPAATAVYAVLDAGGAVQYVGMSRRLATTVAGHVKDVPDKTAAVKFHAVPSGTRDDLTAVWRGWVQEVVDGTGGAPPGNLPDGQAAWAPRRPPPPPPEIKLTPGKGLADLTVGLDALIQRVVDDNTVVAFIKGTRTAPQCGFSHSVLTMLTAQVGSAGFAVVNVLDEVHNPGLRDAIKAFSAWPTLPQVYAHGEFVGGADVLAELAARGELGGVLKGGSK